MKYQTLKVFDCHTMPLNVRRFFHNLYEGVGNDCCVNHTVGSDNLPSDVLDTLDSWLVDNWAAFGEDIVIKHWW